MGFFEQFFNTAHIAGELAVCCPFPHKTHDSGIEYLEQRPSAHVNLVERVYHCKACNKGYNEVTFIQNLYGGTQASAQRLKTFFDLENTVDQWDGAVLYDSTRTELRTLGISDTIIDQLKLKSGKDNEICFPVLMHDSLIDVRTYKPEGSPKMRGNRGSMNGMVIPYDLWQKQMAKNPHATTLICAGEKDMAVARSHGFNAITLTGGEQALPAFPGIFKGLKVTILYDNDETGKSGSQSLADALYDVCSSVKNCTSFHEVCKEPKEDITDFFVKYGKTRQDLIDYMTNTPKHTIRQEELAPATHNIHTVTLREAARPENVGKLMRSNIQVVAISDATYVAPAHLQAEKYKSAEDNDERMAKGDIKEWYLSQQTVADLLHLVDNNFTERKLSQNYRDLLFISQKEKSVRFTIKQKATIFKGVVTDLFETSSKDTVPMEFTAYAVNTQMESGKKYLATYKLVPHPYKGQQLTMMVIELVQANDSISTFSVTERAREQLKVFEIGNSVAERVELISQKFKGVLQYDGNMTLIKVLDFAYHTVLDFDFGTQPNLRGYLDTLVVGESRVGKSSTAEAMRKTYNLGTFVSLSGNAATVAGLIGGSNKVGTGYQTRAGLIPQNHRGLIIFEELGKSHSDILGELTDVRSSNEVRITRVSGALTLPAKVRMVSLTNTKCDDGAIRSIASYPNGISVITSLVGTAEDIARYDVMCVLSDRGAKAIDVAWKPPVPFSQEAYQTRIQWIWSRSSEQVVFSEDTRRYILETANELNRIYGSHIKIFGTEAWKKLARLSVAIAGYCVSSDESFENIVVLPEHVDYAKQFFIELYDNPTFKLKEYVEHERKYSEIDADGIELLQDLFIKSPTMLLHLELASSTTKNTLQAVTGMTNEEYNGIMNQLVIGLFVTFGKYEIMPTERFRKGMAAISRSVRVKRVGE